MLDHRTVLQKKDHEMTENTRQAWTLMTRTAGNTGNECQLSINCHSSRPDHFPADLAS